jgi:SPOR domain
VRAVFFLLVFANLAFLAWAEWIDAPQPAPPNEAYARLPRLKLINEQPADDARPSSGAARKTALEVAPPSPTFRCLSVGPFEDQAGANRGVSQLREKGFTPRQRAEKGEISNGFWVYIGGLKTDGEVAQVLRTLEQGHVEDAHPMSDTGGDVRQVSVGIFSERERADRRAESVQKLGLHPEVAEHKLPATLFWMDVDLPAGAAVPTAQDIPAGGESSHVEVVPCPAEAPPPDALPAPAPGTAEPFRTKVAGAAAAASKVP